MEKQKADQIITEYMQKLYGFAMKKAYSYDEAEELCAEIIKEVYISLRRAGEIVNLEGYIWRISEHTYARYVSVRKKHEGISIDGMELLFCGDYALEDREEEMKRLRREIAFLTEKRRRIIFRFYYEDAPISVIAREMGISEGTVKWHLNKARNELKEGFQMERKIGKLGLAPVTALDFSHGGNPGSNLGPESYLGDQLNLNIVYSVYWQPRTAEEIAEELGMTLVYLKERIDFLEGNGFLVKTVGGRYTTYVKFSAAEYSLEQQEQELKLQLEIAETLVKEYVPLVRRAVGETADVYIPGGNRELLDAAAIFWSVLNKCEIPIQKDLSRYIIKTTAGGRFTAAVDLECRASDPDYRWERQWPQYGVCGSMTRQSSKYPAIFAWSADSRHDSRTGGWQNNLCSDYEYLYEYMKGMLGAAPAEDPVTASAGTAAGAAAKEADAAGAAKAEGSAVSAGVRPAADSADVCAPFAVNPANAEKFARLRERKFLTADGNVNIVVVKEPQEKFFARIPALSDELKSRFANKALEFAMISAKRFPPQMQDLIIAWGVSGFIGATVAQMVADILYGNGTFKPLTENEKVTANLLMFADVLPDAM